MSLPDLIINKGSKADAGQIYDCVIIGGGPAGLTAGIYASRARLKTVLFEEKAIGGQVVVTDIVENYPGFPKGISGADLTFSMEEQARSFGLEIKDSGVTGIKADSETKRVDTTDGHLTTKTIIIGSGAENLKLNVNGEKQFTGKGVSYCATCDAAFFRDREVVVVGGGDTAIGEAIFLTKFAKKIYIIHRRDKLRAVKILQERAFAMQSIEFIWDTVITEIKGNKYVESVSLKNIKTGDVTEKKIDGVFVFIGTKPNTDFVKGLVSLDENGYIITNENMETNIPGIFAAGDVRTKLLRQVATAVGDGAISAYSAEKYIEENRK
ncbi:MAG: thioredoxin-disulfide reductase [Deltaproteobacteria bacterium]|nr:thioredoxin-disulfide reductase [Deltaproteobacteria bacterium]MCL5793183.1 thioredoxin-disulfide reductase [Deltaproteobacteria bacterium]